MSAFRAIYKRQLLAWFCAPAAYFTLTVFLGVAGLSFARLADQARQERLLLGDVFFGSLLFWSMFLVAVAAVTMGIFAEERKSRTLEMLLTAPVTDSQAVVAKFCAAYTCLLLLCAPTLFYWPLLRLTACDLPAFDPLPLLGGWVILAAFGALYTAFGCMVSALSPNPVIAACFCFVGLGAAFFSEIFQYAAPGSCLNNIIGYLSPVQYIMDFSRGVVDTRPLVLCFSGMCLCLFLTVKLLERRHWR